MFGKREGRKGKWKRYIYAACFWIPVNGWFTLIHKGKRYRQMWVGKVICDPHSHWMPASNRFATLSLSECLIQLYSLWSTNLSAMGRCARAKRVTTGSCDVRWQDSFTHGGAASQREFGTNKHDLSEPQSLAELSYPFESSSILTKMYCIVDKGKFWFKVILGW